MLYRLIRKFFSTSSPTLPLHATFLEVGKTDVPIVTNDIVLDMEDDGVGGDGGGGGDGDGGDGVDGDGDGGDDGGDDGDDDDRLTDIVVPIVTNDIVLDMDDDGDDGVGGDGGGEGGDGGGDGGDDGDDDDRLTDIVVCVAVGAMWIGVVGCLVLVFVVVLG